MGFNRSACRTPATPWGENEAVHKQGMPASRMSVGVMDVGRESVSKLGRGGRM
jgi:hypothetical protein